MDFRLLLPEIILASTALLVVLGDLFISRKGFQTIVSLLGIAASIIAVLTLTNQNPQAIWEGLLVYDRLAFFMKLLFLGLAALVILASTDYVRRMRNFHGEYLALILISTLGMMLLTSATNLISVFVALELTSVPLYALTGFLKNQRGTESALKYVLLSAVNSALLLYGLALIFGFTGTASLSGVAQTISALPAKELWAQPGLVLGLVLVLAGFGFKIAAVPFHMWAPDVYEGSPTPIALLLSAGSKLAGFAILLRIPISAFSAPAGLTNGWGILLAILAALGMCLGNLLAIPQTNIKRLLAYSGIAHSGYMLITMAVVGIAGFSINTPVSSLLFYMLAFALAEVVVFTAVIIVSERIGDQIADYAGLGRRAPWLALALTIGLISLTGIPPTAGFIAKFTIFSSAAEGGLWWLVIIAVLNTVISAYYYLRVVRLIWQGTALENTSPTASKVPKIVLLITTLAVLAIGLIPVWGMKLAEFGAVIFTP